MQANIQIPPDATYAYFTSAEGEARQDQLGSKKWFEENPGAPRKRFTYYLKLGANPVHEIQHILKSCLSGEKIVGFSKGKKPHIFASAGSGPLPDYMEEIRLSARSTLVSDRRRHDGLAYN